MNLGSIRDLSKMQAFTFPCVEGGNPGRGGFFFKIYLLFIYLFNLFLAASGLLVAVRRIFVEACKIFRCGPRALRCGAQTLCHSTRASL